MKQEFTPNKTQGEIKKVSCSNCSSVTNHKVEHSLNESWSTEEMYGYDDYEILKCQGCDSVCFRIGSSNSENYEPDESGESLVWPVKQEIYPSRLKGRKLIQGLVYVPIRISRVYEEVFKSIASDANILGGIGMRILIEAVCIEHKSKGNNLKEKIDYLVESGFLTSSNASTLHQLRFLGNSVGHEIIEPSLEELILSLDIVENLLENLYVIPAKEKKLAKKRNT